MINNLKIDLYKKQIIDKVFADLGNANKSLNYFYFRNDYTN